MRIQIAVVLVAIMAWPPLLKAAPSQSDGFAFAIYVQSLSSRLAARKCSKGIPDYRERFDTAFTRWQGVNGTLVAKGEQLFLAAVAAEKERSGDSNKKLELLNRARIDLDQPEKAGAGDGDERMSEALVGWCESVIRDLAAGEY